MSLFGDLPEAKQGEQNSPTARQRTKQSSWSNSFKAPEPKDLKRPQLTAPRAVRNVIPQAKPAPTLNQRLSKAVPAVEGSGLQVDPLVLQGGVQLWNGIPDVYDPSKPNDYEEIVKDRKQKRMEAEQEAERQQKLKEMQRNVEEQKRQQEEKIKHQMQIDEINEQNEQNERKGMTLAQKLLEKMGWKEGQGLGRQQQGMATPLIAQKTDKRSGIIVNAESQLSHNGGDEIAKPEPKKQKKGVMFQGNPTRILCIRNMVGAGEIDDQLEDEVAQELSKYGTVRSVLVFEVTEPDYKKEDAVLVFVEFERAEVATKALIDLQGRYFGGNLIKAGFFDEDRFAKKDLAPTTWD
eukprot:TRINITY_DN3424_c5_g1_i1.p1 TRINITY_DN3424_c5_g1~~TRINITY_DN3424_c5_g1_i1.p1  ORF type:complete len:350 (-),score=79.77 TRINITY_DN3424_c5_g1_i1:397-1446(-)